MYAKVNGYKIFFDVEGLQFEPGGSSLREKPVCLVMHGGPGADHAHFMPDLSPLSEVCQLIYIDDRNCGRSDRIDPETNSIKQNVEDIEALREYLGLDKVFILGQSYGGMKAQYYVSHFPEHLYGAIIVATAPNAEGIANERVAKNVKKWGTEEQYLCWTEQWMQTGRVSFDEYLDIMLPLYHGEGKFRAEEAMNTQKSILTSDEVIRWQFNGELASNDTFNMIPDLKNVDLPCLCIAGEHDFICDVDANREIAEAIPGAEFHVLPNSGHEVFADCPDLVFPIMKDFVERNFK